MFEAKKKNLLKAKMTVTIISQLTDVNSEKYYLKLINEFLYVEQTKKLLLTLKNKVCGLKKSTILHKKKNFKKIAYTFNYVLQ